MILAVVSTINLMKAQWQQVQKMVEHSAVMSMQCLLHMTGNWHYSRWEDSFLEMMALHIQSPHRDQVRTTILKGTDRPGRGTVQKLWIQEDSEGETDRVAEST